MVAVHWVSRVTALPTIHRRAFGLSFNWLDEERPRRD